MASMIDLVFDVQGSRIAADYRWALWLTLRESLPWIDGEPFVGVLGLRTGGVRDGVALLGGRANLTLRVPECRASETRLLEGRRLELGEDPIDIGGARARPLRVASTLYADFVTNDTERETDFVAALDEELHSIGCACRHICGRRRELRAGDRSVRGFAVALHECSPAVSLLVQARGLGGQRHLGCGVFVEHKAICGLE
ncbi:MAG TPA: type I-MYXAN CRISPR-associated protein Cas6/Cmx6 [Burkholderiaceae bacterium]|nr:type I-MYXAN CRISPR-associated protein Cas6/Cmx6 [Burkholderiaceae bacterium]